MSSILYFPSPLSCAWNKRAPPHRCGETQRRLDPRIAYARSRSYSVLVRTPERTTAAAYPRHLTVDVVADSMKLRWTGLFARRYKHPRVVDRFLVPATPEPLIVCQIGGAAEFRERDLGQNWITHQLGRGDIFVTR